MRPVALAKKTKIRKKEKKTVGKLAIRSDHPRRRIEVKVCMLGGLRCVVSSFIKIGAVVLPVWVVENRPSPLLWPLAVQAVIRRTLCRYVTIGTPMVIFAVLTVF